MPTILRDCTDLDYPEGWMHDEDGPADDFADDDYGPLGPPELAGVLGEILDELRHETADRFDAILCGGEG